MTKKKIVGFSFGIAFVFFAILFFFLDLDISILMASNNPNSFFILLAAIGEFPIYIGPILFGLVYGFTLKERSHKLIAHFVGLITTYVASIRLTGGIFEEIFSSNLGVLQYSLLSIVSLLIYILLFMIFNKIKVETLYKLKDIALIYLIVSLSSFFIVTLMKFIWGRVRFRALSEDYFEYSNFLTINGFNNSLNGDNYKSFPSGHTNAASSILILSFIPIRLGMKKIIKLLVPFVCGFYVVTVAVSRICVGAHYASDVLFGFGISCMCFFITYMIFKKKGWLHVRDNKC